MLHALGQLLIWRARFDHDIATLLAQTFVCTIKMQGDRPPILARAVATAISSALVRMSSSVSFAGSVVAIVVPVFVVAVVLLLPVVPSSSGISSRSSSSSSNSISNSNSSSSSSSSLLIYSISDRLLIQSSFLRADDWCPVPEGRSFSPHMYLSMYLRNSPSNCASALACFPLSPSV